MEHPFSVKIIEQTNDKVKFSILEYQERLSFETVFKYWEVNENFVSFYQESLLSFGFEAFYWEHPAFTIDQISKPYECTVQNSVPLQTLRANESAFKDHIYQDELIHDFENLGKDARLVVPSKKSDEEIYNHLGKFLKHGEENQVISLFNRIGSRIIPEVEKRGCVWLNTAGLGVIWLHVRMDTRPKYYKSAEYKNPAYLRIF